MMKSKGAIFDVDGTLLDSMPVWHNIGEIYLESLGITCEKGLGDKIYAMSLEQGASYLRKEYHLEKSESEIIHEVLKIVDDFYRLEAPLKPGVRRVLDWFRNHGIPMAVATSGNRALALAALERTGAAEYFQTVLTCSEIGVGKDEPEIYLQASQALGCKPEETLVFEDAFHAACTACEAGFPVIGVYDESNRRFIHQMQEQCICYCDQMEECIEFLNADGIYRE